MGAQVTSVICIEHSWIMPFWSYVNSTAGLCLNRVELVFHFGLPLMIMYQLSLLLSTMEQLYLIQRKLYLLVERTYQDAFFGLRDIIRHGHKFVLTCSPS
ncbi:unnamed protein product [Malus baccata var. baccata]